MKARYVVPAMLVLAAVAALTTCTDAIFAIIETEKKTATSTLPLTITVADIAAPAPVSGGPYYVGAGGVFQGTLGSSETMDWYPSNDSRPLNPSGTPMCNALAYFAPTGTLWGGFITSSGDAGLYQSSSGTTLSFASSTPVAAMAGKQIVYIQSANGNLFAGTTTDVTNYDLEFTPTGAWASPTLLTGLSEPITGVVWDLVNSFYWASEGKNLYRSPAVLTTSSFVLQTALPGLDSEDLINGLFADSGRVFVATKKSGIYYTTNSGGSWHNIPADEISSVTVSYLCVAGPADSLGPKDLYLVGSDGYGYYTLSISTGNFDRFDDSTVTLHSHSVRRILVDGPDVFMGTNANGFWHAKFDEVTGDLAAGQSWNHE
jgi:hypothetical protein